VSGLSTKWASRGTLSMTGNPEQAQRQAGLRVAGLTRRYARGGGISDLSIEVADGEFLTLIGPSGCGKTTTLRCLAGLETPQAGDIAIGPNVVSSTSRRLNVPPERRRLGMVFQDYALWPHLSVEGNVGYPLRVQGLSRKERAEAVGAALERVRLKELARASVSELSGGQQQRVALARALVGRPAAVLFDEPLSNLDTRLRAEMRTELGSLRRELGMTCLYVTHDQAEALELSDRVMVLEDGVVQQEGTPAEVYARPANCFVAEFMGFENLLTGEVTRVDGAGCTVQLAGCPPELRCDIAIGTPVVGAKVTVAIRASHAALRVPAPEVAGDELEATVTSVAYLGDHATVRVLCGPHTITVRALDLPEQPLTEHLPDIGKRVTVRFPQSRLLAITEQQPVEEER
jgi:iron(III) transport system ATP-binding protein